MIALKAQRPALAIVLNGGIRSVDDARRHAATLDGVMVGREAYQNPCILRDFQRAFGAAVSPPSRRDVVIAMADYAERALRSGVPLKHITRHMLGLFAGQPGARQWRRTLSERAHLADASPQLLLDAMAARDAIAA